MKVLLTVLDDDLGVKALKKANPPPSKHSLLRACQDLRKRKKDETLNALVAWMRELYPSRPTKHPPQHGEVRPYSVQAADDTLFVRTPVGMLKVPRKGTVLASFGKIEKELLNSGKFIVLYAERA